MTNRIASFPDDLNSLGYRRAMTLPRQELDLTPCGPIMIISLLVFRHFIEGGESRWHDFDQSICAIRWLKGERQWIRYSFVPRVTAAA